MISEKEDANDETLGHVITIMSELALALKDPVQYRSPTKQAMISNILFMNIINYNVRIKKLDTAQEVEHGKIFKNKVSKLLAEQPFYIYEFIVNQNFDMHFSGNHCIDWNRYYRFCNRIDLLAVYFEDPIIRNKIRSYNRQFFKRPEDKEFFSSVIQSTIKDKSLQSEIFLVLLELGLLKFSQVVESGVHENLQFEEGSKISYLKILLHLIVLLNDEVFVSASSDKNFYFSNEPIMNMIKQVLEKMNDHKAEEEFTHYINMLLISFFNPPFCFYSQSVKSFERNQPHSQSKIEFLVALPAVSSASQRIEEIEDIMLQILQKYYTVTLTEVSPDLLKKIRAVFKKIEEESTDAQFREQFAIAGGCYTVLALLHQFTPCADIRNDKSENPNSKEKAAINIIGDGLMLLARMCDGSGAIGGQLFKERCYSIIRRLAWFNLRDVSFLLMKACTSAPWILEHSATNLNRLHELFMNCFQDLIINMRDMEEPESSYLKWAYRSMTVLCFAVKEIIYSITNLHSKQTLQLTFQETISEHTNTAIKFILELSSRFAGKDSKAIDLADELIGEEWRDFERSARNPIEGNVSSVQIEAQLHYYVLVLFNSCVVGIEVPGIKSQLKELFKERSTDQSLEGLATLANIASQNNIFYFIQIVNIYCNCILLESDIRSDSSLPEAPKQVVPIRRNSLQNFVAKKEPPKPAAQAGSESLLMFQKGQDDILSLLSLFAKFESKSKSANKDLMYRGLLRFMLKYFKGVLYEKEKVQQQPLINLQRVLDAFINKRELILRMCDVKPSSPLSQESILFMVIKDGAAKEEGPRDAKIVMQFITIIELLYLENPEYKMEIEDFSREELASLQSKNSSLFSLLSTMGSISMSKFIRSMKDSENNRTNKINLFGEEIEESTKNSKKKSLANTVGSTISMYRVEKSMSLSAKRQEKMKTSFLLVTLQEGTDNSKDIFYRNILFWLMKTFSKILNSFEATFKKKGGLLKQKRKDLRSPGPSNIAAKNYQESLISMHFGQTFIKDPLVSQLVTVISNLLNSGLRPRDVFLETFFSKDKNDSEMQDEKAAKEKEEQMKEYKRGLITLLVESAISMQRKIKRRLFTKTIMTICEDYFLACLTIKDIVKGNMIPIKKYIGKECFSGENDKDRNIVQELFNGLVYDKNEMNANSTVLNSNDRVDLAYYNIITLTMLTELVSGPCKENQDSIGDSFINVFALLEKTNQNIKSQLYKVQEAMVLFLVGLLEESNPKNCKKLSSDIPPARIYKIICKHVIHLCENQDLPGNDSSIGRVIRAELSNQKFKNSNKLTYKLREHYRLHPQFANHPSITIAVRLFFLMREVISGNNTKRYERYLKDREAQNDDEEYNIEKMIENQPLLKTDHDPELKYNNAINNVFVKSFGVAKHNKIHPNNIDPSLDKDKMDTIEIVHENQSKDSKILKEISIFEFVKSITSSVEILHQTGETSTNLQIYFPRLPSTFDFKEEQKNDFLQNSSIKDSNAKALDLMNFVSEFQIQKDRERKRLSPLFRRLMEDSVINWYMILLCILGFIINMAYLFDYQLRGGPRFRTYSVQLLVEIVRYITLGLSALGLLGWLIFKYPIMVEKISDRVVSKVYLERKKVSFQTIRRFIHIYFLDTLFEDLFSTTTMVHVLACLLAMYVSEVFISLHLYTLMAFSRTTRYVIKSITEHIDQLMMTLLLTVICIYFYSMLIAHFLGDYISDPNTENANDVEECMDLGSCFFFSTKTGLTNGDGVGIMILTVPQQSPLFIPRILINLTFFILLNLAATNIIFGIILDTFAELRAFQEARGKTFVIRL